MSQQQQHSCRPFHSFHHFLYHSLYHFNNNSNGNNNNNRLQFKHNKYLNLFINFILFYFIFYLFQYHLNMYINNNYNNYNNNNFVNNYFFIKCSSVLPSFSIQSCEQINDPNCQPKMYISITLNEGTTPIISYKSTSNIPIIDNLGRKWLLNEPISIEIIRSDILIGYELNYKGLIKNGYETFTKINYNCYSSNLNYKICCKKSDNEFILRELQFNTTNYHYYDIITTTGEYTIKIIISQKDKSQTLILNQSEKSKSTAGIIATISGDIFDISNYVNFLNEYLIIPKETIVNSDDSSIVNNNENIFEGFLTEKSYFGNQVNQFGITKQNYFSFTKCDDKLGLSTFVKSSTNPYDQFDKFRKIKISNVLQNCEYVPNLETSSTNLITNLKRNYKCQKSITTLMTLQIPTTGEGFQIKKLFGTPVITKSGTFDISKNDNYLIFYLDIFNNADTSGNYEVSPTSCCINSLNVTNIVNNNVVNDNDCDSVKMNQSVEKNIDAYQTNRFLFQILLQRIINKKGTCTFQIKQYGNVDLTHSITFQVMSSDINNDNSNNNNSPIINYNNFCLPPFNKKILNLKGEIECITECQTNDMIYDELQLFCKPVNCKLKYNNLKNYFNFNTLQCEKVVTCNEWKEYYDEENNKCKIKDIFNNTILENEEKIKSLQFYNENDFLNNFVNNYFKCGEFGVLDKYKLKCICKDYYFTNYDITTNLYNKNNTVVMSRLAQNIDLSTLKFCNEYILKLEKAPSKFIYENDFLQNLYELPDWAQIIIIITIFFTIFFIIFLFSNIIICCGIKKINMEKEANKRKYGTLQKKSLFKFLKDIIVKGEFKKMEYKISEEILQKLQQEKIEKKKWKKKRKKQKLSASEFEYLISKAYQLTEEMNNNIDQLIEEPIREKIEYEQEWINHIIDKKESSSSSSSEGEGSGEGSEVRSEKVKKKKKSNKKSKKERKKNKEEDSSEEDDEVSSSNDESSDDSDSD